MIGLFVAATGTGCGKTWIARGLTRAATRAGRRVAPLKPVETGVTLTATDALALGRAAGREELANAPGLHRFRAPLSPRAAELAGAPGLDPTRLVLAVQELFVPSEIVVIEGAGGLLTPIARGVTVADLAAALGFPLILVAPDALGTLSHTTAAVECARARGLRVAAVALVAQASADGSERHNAAILREELGLFTVHMRRCRDDDDDLAAAVVDAGLYTLLDAPRRGL